MLVLVAALGSIGLSAAPAFAAVPTTSVTPFCSGGSNPDITENPDCYAALPKEQGINVSQIVDWGGCVQAMVTDSTGRISIMYFDPDTLRQIGTIGSPVTLG
ncbi:MAG: hypothetical protein HY834_11300 [Devosia nanyangense]|uniref:PepSY domain-containing protein n=1 Tax=Devosia nanyangense TaxID=1228055 RepID=A0A933NZA9_9HYPH|nr:hypothetical protein [Devosia nanyangense]